MTSSKALRRCVAATCVLVAGCGFRVGGGADVAPDAPPAFCAPDPTLPVCYTFDQDPLPASLPNEGAVAVSAALTSITRVASTSGGAAQLGATSGISLPTAPVSGVLTMEVWFRVDAFPGANGGREGLMDSNVSPQNISLFFYRQDPAHTLRCGIGGQVEVWPTTGLVLGAWHYAACTCLAGTLAAYLDGTKVGENPGACGTAGGFVDGFTIGSDNTGGGGVGDRLVGAIDGLRLWTTALTAQEVCTRAGRTGC